MIPLSLPLQTPQEPAVWFVCFLGIGVVFVGLICLIFIVSIMNLIFLNSKRNTTSPKPTIVDTQPHQVENKEEIVAAVCSAIAEENGTDVSAIRVLSFKKI